jgi:uncharacterized membrane protein
MPSFPNSWKGGRLGGLGAVLFTTLAVIYPIAVYFLHDRAPFLLFAGGACCLLLLRAFVVRSELSTMLRAPMLVAVGVIVALSTLDAAIAAKAYPAVLSVIVATVFGNSLRHPPSIIERIARIEDPHLTVTGQAYCRKVTWVWTIWLVANAVVATGLALWGSLDLWALWTGLVSYLVMGVLFSGEIMLRPWLLRRAGA